MDRIAIVGNSGSGKTTLARALQERLGLDHVEIDAFNHQPGWTPREPELLRAELAEALPIDGRWVVDGNYESLVGDLARGRADTIVWLDYPRRVVMQRVIRRTLRRVATREELWNGNREPLTNLFKFNDPEANIIRWSWSMHAKYRRQHEAASLGLTWQHAVVHRFPHPDDLAAWVNALPMRSVAGDHQVR